MNNKIKNKGCKAKAVLYHLLLTFYPNVLIPILIKEYQSTRNLLSTLACNNALFSVLSPFIQKKGSL